jgi:hypothetical protein
VKRKIAQELIIKGAIMPTYVFIHPNSNINKKRGIKNNTTGNNIWNKTKLFKNVFPGKLNRAKAYPVTAPKNTTEAVVIEDTNKLLNIDLINVLVEPVVPKEKTV